jgi:RNA polymerase sigma-70 factor, ECF subfamily
MSDRGHDIDQRRLLAAAQAGDERAWRALERFEPRAQFQTRLYRIATNACLDELERRPRRPEPVDPFPDRPSGDSASPTYDPAARYAIREGMELALLRAIQELPGRQRAVLILRDVLGWTASEVAELLQSTVASVNSALQRARGTIDRHLPETTRAAAGPVERELLYRYVAAFEHADIDGLVSVLREDATLRMPPQPSLVGGLQIARFFLETVAQGDLTRIRHRPTWANGRPAVTIEVRAEDGTWIPHGISVLEIEDSQIVGIDAFLDPALLPRFGLPSGRQEPPLAAVPGLDVK